MALILLWGVAEMILLRWLFHEGTCCHVVGFLRIERREIDQQSHDFPAEVAVSSRAVFLKIWHSGVSSMFYHIATYVPQVWVVLSATAPLALCHYSPQPRTFWSFTDLAVLSPHFYPLASILRTAKFSTFLDFTSYFRSACLFYPNYFIMSLWDVVFHKFFFFNYLFLYRVSN